MGYPVEIKYFCDSLCGMFPEKYEVPRKTKKEIREMTSYMAKTNRDFARDVKEGKITNPHPKMLEMIKQLW